MALPITAKSKSCWASAPIVAPQSSTTLSPRSVGHSAAIAGRSIAPGRETTDAIFALGQLARCSGDRVRDFSDQAREAAVEALSKLGADETTLAPVRHYRELEAAQEGEALGDSLPIGLRLRTGSETS